MAGLFYGSFLRGEFGLGCRSVFWGVADKGSALTAGHFWQRRPKSNQKRFAPGLALVPRVLHSGDAPWARAERTSMSLRRSRGTHAARPTPRHLRSACTQVAMGVVWTVAHEDQDQKRKLILNSARPMQSGLPPAAVLRAPPAASRTVTGGSLRWLLILLFIRNGSDAAERDLGAGRTQAMWSGPSGRDAARAAPRHGWRMAAGPRSIAGAEGTRRRRAKPGAGPFWLLLWLLTKVTRRKGGTVSSRYRRNG